MGAESEGRVVLVKATVDAMGTKWTPGEWRVESDAESSDLLIFPDDPKRNATAQVFHNHSEGRDVALANAHLSAAAPDLYAVAMKFWETFNDPNRAEGDYGKVADAAAAAIAKARDDAALARARGER
jgi:hypothetical protein